MMGTVKDTAHFSERELRCKCYKCDFPGMDENFMIKLEEIRTDPRWDRPIIVTSGYRCPNHNQSVSATGSRTGPHTTLRACDILVSRMNAVLLTSLAYDKGMTGFGWHQRGDYAGRIIHLDDLPNADGQPRPHCWTYS